MANEIEIKVPDIGGATRVDVIEILVQVGEEIAIDTSLITLESDKASMEIPSPISGRVSKIQLKVGDKVSQGDSILWLVSDEANQALESKPKAEKEPELKPKPDQEAEPKRQDELKPQEMQGAIESPALASDTSEVLFAGPAVRRMARELDINLQEVKGSARKSRITKEDLQAYVKTRLKQAPVSGGFNLPAAAPIDFSVFGETEVKPLNKIKKLTGAQVHRSWISIPHVTQFDEADITDLEAFRKLEAPNAMLEGYKLTLLAFVCRVVSKALQVYPQFNASLDASGENLIYKKYCNIGIAVETPSGLVVPVIKDADKRGIRSLAQEMARLSQKAREKGLMPNDMSGACFTISSLGGIGGTAFTPIVNSPEVAILGLSRALLKPVYVNGELKPRLMLGLSLSYDHRVIDGAEAARFTRFLCDSLGDIRRILL